MFWLYLSSMLYGLWAFNHADMDNQHDVGLALVYYTFVTLSFLYFMWSFFRKKNGGYPLRYRLNNICLLGAATAISVPVIIKTTATMLVALYFLI